MTLEFKENFYTNSACYYAEPIKRANKYHKPQKKVRPLKTVDKYLEEILSTENALKILKKHIR